MKEPMIDAERLAALLDGRLDERRRDEAVEHLASSDEAFESYVDAAAVLSELEGTAADRVAPAGSPARKHGWRPSGGRWLALAAVLAGAALTSWIWVRARTPDGYGPERYVEALSNPATGLPPGWIGRPWGTTRGAGDAVPDEARAARLGARMVDLELAVRTRDARASGIAAEVVSLLEDVPGAALIAGDFRRIQRQAGEPPERLMPILEEGRKGVRRMVDRDFLELGAWAEAGRLAAARRDPGFFRDRATRDALGRASGLRTLDAQARRSVERIRASLDGEPQWSTLEGELTELLRSLGR